MKTIILITSLILLVGCATTPYAPPGNIPEAAARLDAAQAEYAAAAAQSTQQAAAVTAVYQSTIDANNAASTAQAAAATQTWQATADSLTVQQTQEAIYASSTRESIAANATATAVGQAALIEAQLVADEATRVAQQREAERIEMAYQKTKNTVMPFVYGIIAFAFLAAAGAFVWRLLTLSKPVRDGNGRVMALPANAFQVMPGRMLPAPEPEIPQIIDAPQPVTLPKLATGHVLIAGETGSGKTTAMRAILESRQNVVVLDPHDDGQTWAGARVIGGGRDFEAIGSYMQYMRSELAKRYRLRTSGQPVGSPLTVATDEMPAIVAALGRGIDDTWREWLREGRKVGLYFAVSTQSTRVKTLGIKGEGDLLENFTYVIALGKVAVNEYGPLVAGMERPAVIQTVGGVRPLVIPYNGDGVAMIPPPQNHMQIAGAHLADPENLTERDRQRIRELLRKYGSKRKVEQIMFGYTGGAAYKAVTEVANNVMA